MYRFRICDIVRVHQNRFGTGLSAPSDALGITGAGSHGEGSGEENATVREQ